MWDDLQLKPLPQENPVFIVVAVGHSAQVGDNIAGERMALEWGFRIRKQNDILFKDMPLSEQIMNLFLVTRGDQIPVNLVGKVLELGRLVKDDEG